MKNLLKTFYTNIRDEVLLLNLKRKEERMLGKRIGYLLLMALYLLAGLLPLAILPLIAIAALIEYIFIR